MIELLRKALELVLRFLDWRREGRRTRAREDVRRAVVEHDREAMNTLIMERMNRRD